MRFSNAIINGGEDEESKNPEPKKKFGGKKQPEPEPDQMAKFKSFAPTLIGLATIPFIIFPIDNSVDFVMDLTYRQIFPKLY